MEIMVEDIIKPLGCQLLSGTGCGLRDTDCGSFDWGLLIWDMGFLKGWVLILIFCHRLLRS